jgi:hypothetical protein
MKPPGHSYSCGRAVLQGAEDQPGGAVDLSGLRCVKTSCEVSEAGGIDGSHLVDQHQGPGAVDVGATMRVDSTIPLL